MDHLTQILQDALKERDEELEQKDGEIEDLKQRLAQSSDEIKVLATQIDEERAKALARSQRAKVQVL